MRFPKIPVFKYHTKRFSRQDIRFGLSVGVFLLLCVSMVSAQATSFYQSALGSEALYTQAQELVTHAGHTKDQGASLYDQFQTKPLDEFAGIMMAKYGQSVMGLMKPALISAISASQDPPDGEQILDDFEGLGEFKFVESHQLDDKTNFKMNFMALLEPVKHPKISSRFGYRRGRIHAGTDFSAPIGTPIYASSDGKVLHSAYSGGYGQLITIQHGEGVITRYAHCSRLLVRAGQAVKKGQLIGKVGNTGHSTGPHLHYELIVKGYHLNPEKYLNGIDIKAAQADLPKRARDL